MTVVRLGPPETVTGAKTFGSFGDLLERIRQSPAMYLAPPSAETLCAFVTGHELACGADSEFQQFSGNFGDWLRKRYRLNLTQHWTKIIEFYAASQAEEMPLFWRLYDEFEKKKKRKKKT